MRGGVKGGGVEVRHVWWTSSSLLDLKQTQAALIRKPSWSLMAACAGLCPVFPGERGGEEQI